MEQQNLNSTQRRQVSRRFRKLFAREQNEMIRLLKELMSEIRAEFVSSNASNGRAQQHRLSSDEAYQEAAEVGGDGRVDWSWGDATERNDKKNPDN